MNDSITIPAPFTFKKPLFLAVSFIVFFISSISNQAFAKPSITSTIPITGIAPYQPLTNFDKKFINFMKRWRIPGGSVAIMKNDSVILSRGYGWADKENHQPVQPQSLFRIASVSKAITAVAILQLVEEGKLRLDDKVYEILDHLTPLADASIRPGIYKITLRHLLQMSSGWSTDATHDPDPMFGPWTWHMAKLLGYKMPPDCLTATRMMMSIPMQFNPGTHYSYSNINYCMLGLIINKITGLQGGLGYQTYIQNKLLVPAGILSMRLAENDLAGRFPGEVKYYDYSNKRSKNQNISGLPYSNHDTLKKNYADGGWIASSLDLAKFLQALAHHRILSPAMFKTMMERPVFQLKPQKYFAMGWTVRYSKGHQYWCKTGSFTGTTALVVLKDDGTSYAAIFNTKPGDRTLFIDQLQNLLFEATV